MNLNRRNVKITLSDVNAMLRSASISQSAISIDIYQTAFTHKSYVLHGSNKKFCKLFQPTDDKLVSFRTKSYEAIEFYGDSIVAAATVEYLFKRYYDKFDEGELTKLKNIIVSSTYLSMFASKFNFQKFLLLANGFENVYGRNVERLLEDTFEAFVAAISLDISYQVAKQFVVFCVDRYVNFGYIIHYNDNYKDRILNYFQLQGWSHPRYEIVAEFGPQHKKSFVVKLVKISKRAGNKDLKLVITEGVGRTKKEAEMAASKNALIRYGLSSERGL